MWKVFSRRILWVVSTTTKPAWSLTLGPKWWMRSMTQYRMLSLGWEEMPEEHQQHFVSSIGGWNYSAILALSTIMFSASSFQSFSAVSNKPGELRRNSDPVISTLFVSFRTNLSDRLSRVPHNSYRAYFVICCKAAFLIACSIDLPSPFWHQFVNPKTRPGT